jgi:hypothetical protein
MGFDAERTVLQRMGVNADIPDSGCCGLAGSWGFEHDKYAISMDCGERVLFPAVREAPSSMVIVADGFSCRTQIAQGTDRRALHLAQLIRSALPGGPDLPPERPERAIGSHRPALRRPLALTLAGAAAAAAVGAAARARSRT